MRKWMACESCGGLSVCSPPDGDLNGAWWCKTCTNEDAAATAQESKPRCHLCNEPLKACNCKAKSRGFLSNADERLQLTDNLFVFTWRRMGVYNAELRAQKNGATLLHRTSRVSTAEALAYLELAMLEVTQLVRELGPRQARVVKAVRA